MDAMAEKRLRILVGVVVCILGMLLGAHPGRAQPGFISIDCGNVQPYTDTDTNISYVADTYISTGTIVTGLGGSSSFQDLRTLRSFPTASTPKKNCYEVPVEPNNQYFVRATLYYGGYIASQTSTINFQLALDSNIWTDVSIDSSDTLSFNWYEAIYYPQKPVLSVCLIRTVDTSEPFISTLELRRLPPNIYLDRYQSSANYWLWSLVRRDFGGVSRNSSLRYPDDPYDRRWQGQPANLNYTSISAPAGQKFGFNSSFDTPDYPPDKVMQTAITDPTLLNFSAGYADPKLYSQLYVSFYIAEVEALPAGSRRVMDFSGTFFDPVTLDTSLRSPYYIHQLDNFAFQPTQDNSYVSLVVRQNSTSTPGLGPILNGYEVYAIVTVNNGTDAAEVVTLADIKTTLGIQVWSGDPCFPVPWAGVTCTQDKVTSIDVSNEHLTGVIPDFSALTALTSLNLSSNGFTGPLPGWVAGLTSLTTLDVSNNQLNGTFPATYITTIPGFRYSNNLQLTCVPADAAVCPSVPAPAQPSPPTPGDASSPPPPSSPAPSNSKKSSSSGAIIGAVVGILLLVAVIITGVLLYCCWYKPKKSQVKIQPPQSPFMNIAPSQGTTPLLVHGTRGKAQPFTLVSVKEATENFARKIGEGGFGPVYFGVLPNQQEVAVKVMSGKTQQGFSEFSNEIDLLSTVHYNKLVSLVGYCQEGKDLILLYEYMSGGDLRQRLCGPMASQSPLTWRQRLQIAFDAAKGLEYLHHGCSPAIFHRDVKSSNILLTEKLEAKMADFGLSKITDIEQSHVTTMVKGTLGYLDPEYNSTGMLSDKSDVYSFGVVLLELLSGQPPISTGSKFIVDKVRAAMNTGSLQAVADPGLGGDYDVEALWKLAEVAMSCVPLSAASRPDMMKVVAELGQALEIEFRVQVNSRWDSSGSDLFTTNFHSKSGTLPPEPSQIFHQDVRPR